LDLVAVVSGLLIIFNNIDGRCDKNIYQSSIQTSAHRLSAADMDKGSITDIVMLHKHEVWVHYNTKEATNNESIWKNWANYPEQVSRECGNYTVVKLRDGRGEQVVHLDIHVGDPDQDDFLDIVTVGEVE
jgi:hypothetical protein